MKFKFSLKLICLIVAAVFLLMCIIDIRHSISAVVNTKTRAGPINLGFKALYIWVVVPYVFGVVTGNKELLILFMIVCGHSILTNFIFLFSATGVPSVIFVFNILTQIAAVGCVFLYWTKVTKGHSYEVPPEEKTDFHYGIKRFGNYLHRFRF